MICVLDSWFNGCAIAKADFMNYIPIEQDYLLQMRNLSRCRLAPFFTHLSLGSSVLLTLLQARITSNTMQLRLGR